MGTQPVGLQQAITINFIDEQRISEIEMPYLIGGNTVKSRKLLFFKKEINTSGKWPVAWPIPPVS